jgi:hypothetical protein
MQQRVTVALVQSFNTNSHKFRVNSLTLLISIAAKMRVKRSTKPFEALERPLEVLIRFLNVDLDRLSGHLWWKSSPLSAVRGAEEQFRTVQKRVRTDILSIIEAGNPADMEVNLRRVIAKIEAMKIRSFLGVWRWNSKTRELFSAVPPYVSLGQAFEINGVRLFTFEMPNAQSDEEIHYWGLFRVLRNGEFSRLRKCPNSECRKFLEANNLAQKFCSMRCKHKYNNERRRKDGYFTEAWQKRRQFALNTAKKMLPPAGRTVSDQLLEQIQKKTKLTPRILLSRRLIDRSEDGWVARR